MAKSDKFFCSLGLELTLVHMHFHKLFTLLICCLSFSLIPFLSINWKFTWIESCPEAATHFIPVSIRISFKLLSLWALDSALLCFLVFLFYTNLKFFFFFLSLLFFKKYICITVVTNNHGIQSKHCCLEISSAIVINCKLFNVISCK